MAKYSFLNQAIFSVDDIKDSFATESTMFGALKRLTDSGKIVKLKGGLYATVNPITSDIYVNRFEIATALHSGGYAAYHTALEYYGLATQCFSNVYTITEKHYSPIIIEGLEYECFQNAYNEGVLEINRNAKIRVTELERTIVDCLDRMLLGGGIEEVFMGLAMLTYCEEDKLLKHIAGYGKKVLYKKAGYLFSVLNPSFLSKDFYRECKDKMSTCDDDIRENRLERYVYVGEWKLYAPTYLMNTEN